CTEQALRLRVQIRVDRNEVALSQKRVEVDARCLQVALDVRSLDLVCVEHLHSPTKVKLASDGVADPSHPDDAERATDEVLAEPAQWIPRLPAAVTRILCTFAQPSGGCQQQGNGDVCSRLGEHARGVADADAPLCGGSQVDVVESDREIADHLQLRS